MRRECKLIKSYPDCKFLVGEVIEFEHGTINTSVTEVQKTYQFCKNALIS